MNRHSYLLVLLLLVLSSGMQQAFAGDKEGNARPGDKEGNGLARSAEIPGDKEGNGGYAAACGITQSNFMPDAFVALELAEAQVHGYHPVPAENLMSLESVITKYIQPIVELMQPADRDAVLKDLSMLVQAVNGVDVRVAVPVKTLVSSRQAYNQYPLMRWVRSVKIKKDTGATLLNGTCKIYGAIAQYPDSLIQDVGSKYEIVQYVWMNLGFADQAALLFHEVLYKQILAKDPSHTSEIVRDIVALAFTKEGAEATNAERVSLLRQAGF